MSLEFITELAQPKAIDLRVRNATIDGTATFNGSVITTGNIGVMNSNPSISIINNATNLASASLILEGNATAAQTKLQSDHLGNAILQDFQSNGTISVLSNNGNIVLNPGTASSQIINPVLMSPASVSFTPVLLFGSNVQTPSSSNCFYYVLGNVVFVSIIQTFMTKVGSGNLLYQPASWAPAVAGFPPMSSLQSLHATFTNATIPDSGSTVLVISSGAGGTYDFVIGDTTTPSPALTSLNDTMFAANYSIIINGFYLWQ